MTIATIRDALSDAVATVTGISRATPYITDQVSPPHAVVMLQEVDYDLVFGRNGDTYNFSVAVYADRASEKQAQILFDTLRDPSGATSLKTVVEANAALAAVVDYARVRTASPIQAANVAGTDYLVVEFTVEVVA